MPLIEQKKETPTHVETKKGIPIAIRQPVTYRSASALEMRLRKNQIQPIRNLHFNNSSRWVIDLAECTLCLILMESRNDPQKVNTPKTSENRNVYS